MPTLRINGVEIATSGPMTILEAAKSAGIEIPHYCYHPGTPGTPCPHRGMPLSPGARRRSVWIPKEAQP